MNKKAFLGEERRKAYFLKSLDDFLHVNELAIVSLVREIHIDSPDIVNRHLSLSLLIFGGLSASEMIPLEGSPDKTLEHNDV